MKIQYNVAVGKFTWLNAKIYINGGGEIKALYLPENEKELKDIVVNLKAEGYSILVFGHTSNCYFLPSFNADVVVCTRLLSQYQIFEDRVVCQPGASIKKIARELTYNGFKGYSGMIDLPGTIAAAVVNNAGCYGCETKDIVESVRVVTTDGSIQILKSKDLGFQRRSSIFKRKEFDGTILSVTLKKEVGEKKQLIEHAEQCQLERKATQPTPSNNLGSCFMSGRKDIRLRIMERIVRACGSIFCLNRAQKFRLLLWLLGQKKMIPYLYDINRFMFIDKNAHVMFNEYVSFYRKFYKDAKLEIEIFK